MRAILPAGWRACRFGTAQARSWAIAPAVSIWSALEDLTGRADPLPEIEDLRRRATGGE